MGRGCSRSLLIHPTAVLVADRAGHLGTGIFSVLNTGYPSVALLLLIRCLAGYIGSPKTRGYQTTAMHLESSNKYGRCRYINEFTIHSVRRGTVAATGNTTGTTTAVYVALKIAPPPLDVGWNAETSIPLLYNSSIHTQRTGRSPHTTILNFVVYHHTALEGEEKYQRPCRDLSLTGDALGACLRPYYPQLSRKTVWNFAPRGMYVPVPGRCMMYCVL